MAPETVAPLAAGADAPRNGRVWLAAILAVAVVGIVGLARHSYVTRERELTEAALQRQHVVGPLATGTLRHRGAQDAGVPFFHFSLPNGGGVRAAADRAQA